MYRNFSQEYIGVLVRNIQEFQLGIYRSSNYEYMGVLVRNIKGLQVGIYRSSSWEYIGVLVRNMQEFQEYIIPSRYFSPTLSTVSSVLNALSAVTGQHIVGVYWPDLSERIMVIVSKLLGKQNDSEVGTDMLLVLKVLFRFNILCKCQF